jgi:L-threonylcarbamoyladenylate synthase
MFNLRKIKKAKEYLEDGGVILCPTDTIWGLSCDALNEKAVEEIFEIKRRSKNKKFLILVNSFRMLEDYLGDVPEIVLETMRLENPITIIYPKAENIPSYLLSIDGSIAIRITKDPNLRKLISFLGHPIISTSANIGGEKYPQKFKDIDRSIIKSVDYILRLKEKKNRKPSKILKLEGDRFKVVRD